MRPRISITVSVRLSLKSEKIDVFRQNITQGRPYIIQSMSIGQSVRRYICHNFMKFSENPPVSINHSKRIIPSCNHSIKHEEASLALWALYFWLGILSRHFGEMNILLRRKKLSYVLTGISWKLKMVVVVVTDVRQLVTTTRHLPPNCTNFITYYQLYEFFHLA